jgi:Family of unknown function (DUF6328)
VAVGDPRDETPEQREDRNLAELLQELRVAGLGVQVLFGAAVALILSYVAAGVPAVVITIVVIVMFAGLWFAFPLSRRR